MTGLLVHLPSVSLFVGSLWIAVRVRRFGNPVLLERNYLLPILVVLVGMCIELGILVAATDSAILRVAFGGVSLVAFGAVILVALTDPEHDELPPWLRDPL